MSSYLTPRTVFVIIKFWTVGATLFTFGVVYFIQYLILYLFTTIRFTGIPIS